MARLQNVFSVNTFNNLACFIRLFKADLNLQYFRNASQLNRMIACVLISQFITSFPPEIFSR